MDRSADLDALNIAARSPLHVAILSSQQDAALFLLKSGVEVDGTDGLGKVSGFMLPYQKHAISLQHGCCGLLSCT